MRVSMLLVVAGVIASAACTSAALPDWKIAQLKDADLENWGEAVTQDGRSCRAAQAGAQAKITVPIWWGESLRPAEGTVYVLKVAYKDTAAKPVVFSAHAGVGSYITPQEVHRFGGFADGKWKTAQVPISWDLICRKNAPGDVTELFVRSDRDLPVESIAVAVAGEGAAERYARETREWIARVQAEKAKTASRGRKQKPVLPASMAKQVLIPYARTYMSPLMPSSAPQKGEAGAALKLRMARNEYEPATFGVYANGKPLGKVDFTVSDLVGPPGKLACEVERRTAEYGVVAGGRGGYRVFPNRLWPAYAVDIPAGQSHWFWVTVKTLGEASRPGLYSGKVRITADGHSAELPIQVEVVAAMLPTMQEAGLDLGSCTPGLVTYQELKTLAEHNHTGMHLWFGGVQPKMTVADGKLTNDWYYIDPWMQYAAKKLGMTHMFWFLGGDPYGFPDSVTFERDLYRALEGDVHVGRRKFLKETNENPEKVVPPIRKLYVDWVRQTAKFAKQHGWPKLVLHPFDEPAKWVQSSKWDNPYHPVIGTGKWIRDHFKDCCALIREGAKGYDNVLVGGDIHHAKPGIIFVKDIDVFCTNAIHEDLKLGDTVRAAGTQFWQYSGGGETTAPHQPRFTFGWYFAAFNSRGSLVWAYNFGRAWDSSTGSAWSHGWPTPFGTVIAPFLPGLREGWDDRRWIELYKKTVAARDPAAKEALDEIFQTAIRRRSRGGRDTVYDFYAEMKRYQDMDVWRGKIIDGVLKVTGK